MPIESSADAGSLEGFLELPLRLYANDENAPRPDVGKTAKLIARLDRSGTQRAFVAREEGRVVARLLARVGNDHLDRNGMPLGVIGFFEAENDSEAVTALLDEATRFLESHGCRTTIGPMDGDTWHRYRVNAGPFDSPTFLLEPYNPPYYAALWEAAGFIVLESYSSKRVEDISPLESRLQPKFGTALAAGYVFKPLDLKRFREELRRVYEISRVIFRDNFLYTDIAFEEFLPLYDGAERLLDDDSAWFAIAPDGSDAGFVFSYPDRFAAVRSAGSGIVGKVRALASWHRVSAVNYKTIGVMPEHRRGGTGGALLYCAYAAALRRGRLVANHCLMRDGNASERMDAGYGVPFRRYLLYSKGLAPA